MVDRREVSSVLRLPSPLERLSELAYNLWWTWQPDAASLFRRLDPSLWAHVEENPIAFLRLLSPRTLEAAAGEPAYVRDVVAVLRELDEYLAAATWWQREHTHSALRVAYFCAEFAVAAALPIYSGGLGVLAGDHLKSASDLGVPLVGVGLAYAEGYCRQSIDAEGNQHERYPRIDFATRPMRLVADTAGKPVKVHLEFADRALRAQVWRVQVGRVPLFLLDANVPENSAGDRAITARLYGGDADVRVRQEVLLGVGGVRALAALGQRPNVFHMNEGHSAFLALERARAAMATNGALGWSAAVATTRRSAVFTTHTPVPAGNDVFEAPLVEWYLRGFRDGADVPTEAILALGRPPDPTQGSKFSMPVLALRTSAHANGVSKLHGEVARRMWRDLWPERGITDIPIGSVTNGVHAPTWMASAVRKRATAEVPDQPSDAALWQLRRGLRAQMIERLATWPGLEGGGGLAPNVLTVGFARRFATYKRAALFLGDADRLRAILLHDDRPVQIVIAGKAHPKDELGKGVLREVIEAVRDRAFEGRLAFLPDYDVKLAGVLVSGCDVWLNTPRRLEEASGTSGMKAAMNGGLNFSVLDGWWYEAYESDIGWAVGGRVANLKDAADAESLYDTLEQTVVPLFYNRDAEGIPREWCAMMRRSMARLTVMYDSDRMVREYVQSCYLPALEAPRPETAV